MSAFEMWVNIAVWVARKVPLLPTPPKNISARTSQRLVEASTSEEQRQVGGQARMPPMPHMIRGPNRG